jgi:4-hydroxyproline epimerase
MKTLEIVESHTGGEPTRVVIDGSFDLSSGTMAEKVLRVQGEYDWIRRSICHEPRGHEAMVGALITPTDTPDCVCGVIFFNNVSTLHMCIHGTIGLIATLRHLGRIPVGEHRIDTAVGIISATLHADGLVAVTNVPSFLHAAGVAVKVPGYGVIHGDIAWGGNWFFLIDGQGPEVDFANRETLTDFTKRVRSALQRQAITAPNGEEIDHIEVFGPPGDSATADSRNFVLCPGNAYDRSPCGTGTSAKLACLHAAGKIQPGQPWRQAGILDTVFTGEIAELPDGKILPRVSGRAWINGRSTYYLDPSDPFCHGLP